MQLSCFHCGKPFTISKDQLGGRGHCPHCRGEIQLPGAPEEEAEETAAPAPHRWWENSISGLVSVVVHMVLMLILAMISYDALSGVGTGEEVLLGEMPSSELSDAEEEELSVEGQEVEAAEEQFEEIEIEPLTTTTSDSSAVDIAELTPLSGGNTGSFELGTVQLGGSMGGGGWDGLLQNLRKNGLDIVITFDSTGSMGGEIRQVTRQISRIGNALARLVPQARIGLCTYRDTDSAGYVVRGLPLTKDLQQVERFLAGVSADEGGDLPEAVHAGLNWAVENNDFRSNARKVILLFGDAPPHREHREECLQVAADFHRQQKGVVSTVTCRRSVRLPEFEEIAQMGGGEAFLTSDERQIVTQLMILVFGSQYRSKVLAAFDLMER